MTRYDAAYLLIVMVYLGACYFFDTAIPVAVGFVLGCVGQMILEARTKAATASMVDAFMNKAKEKA